MIDTSKGLDVEELNELVKSATPPAVENSVELVVTPTPPPKPKQISIAQEQAQAKKVINASKKAVASMFHDVRMGKAVNVEAAMQMVDEIASSVDRNLGALISLVRLKNKDEYTYMHSVAVCALMVALAKELGLSQVETKKPVWQACYMI